MNSNDLANVMGSFIETELNSFEELNKELEEKDKEIERLKVEIKELNDDNVWWTNRFNAVERDNERLNNIIKEVREYFENHTFDYDDLMLIKPSDVLEILDKVGEE